MDSLASSYMPIATIYEKLKFNFKDAVNYQDKALVLAEKLYVDFPENARYKRGYAVGLFNRAEVLVSLEEFEKSKNDYEKSLEVMNDLVNSDEQNQDYKFVQAAVETSLAGVYVKLKEPRKAFPILQKSLQTINAAQEKNPQDELLKFRKAIVHENYGKAYKAVAEDKNSRADWQKANEHFQKSYEIYKYFKDAGKAKGQDAKKVDELAELVAESKKAI